MAPEVSIDCGDFIFMGQGIPEDPLTPEHEGDTILQQVENH
jgi:hypothetical protein